MQDDEGPPKRPFVTGGRRYGSVSTQALRPCVAA
jgi:hypothetical protein